jgi:hypothetical protein
MTTTLTTTGYAGVAPEMRYVRVALPSTLALVALTVFVVLYRAVVVTPARAAVETMTFVDVYCLGVALLIDAVHVNGAAEATGARAMPPNEPRVRVAMATTAAIKRGLIFLAGGQAGRFGFIAMTVVTSRVEL